MTDRHITTPEVAFVLGGGGALGGHQVGMVRALLERGITPDLVVGTSIGSIQGAMVARNPTLSVCEEMVRFWDDFVNRRVMGITPSSLLKALTLRPEMKSNTAVRGLLADHFPRPGRIEELQVPYQCVAASIERATVRYFDSGPLVPALLASSAVPGLWPPVRIGAEHYVDGGVTESVPLARAVASGARTIYVLRMRQNERPLRPARTPWQLGATIFEVSRRHHLHQVLNSRPDGVRIHVLPSGEDEFGQAEELPWPTRRRQLTAIHRRIDLSYAATSRYLDERLARQPVIPRRTASTPFPERAANGKVPPMVAEKHRRQFVLFDHDTDGAVTAADFTAAGTRMAALLGHETDSLQARALRDAFVTYWRGVTAEAGAPPSATLRQETFTAALSQLVRTATAYDTCILPSVTAILMAADDDQDGLLNAAETRRLLQVLGADEQDAGHLARRLDTNGDGMTSLDELSESFHDYFTSDEPGCVGNLLFGGTARRTS
ncbi:patatin-like phospholipase family protein [Streptomyces sp. NPDC048111]|uniref:patatin-like phospholipase family protein n=1 Tax=Streptomyces sp. NPDC048111 TaxID=3365500 RepID=UPI0037244CFE